MHFPAYYEKEAFNEKYSTHRSDLLKGGQRLQTSTRKAQHTSEVRLQTSHRCLCLWPGCVATALYQSHPAFVTAKRNCCSPSARSCGPRQALGSESPITWPKSCLGILPHPPPLLREWAKNSGPVQREHSDLPSREGAGNAQSPPFLLCYISPKQQQSPWSFFMCNVS